MGPSCIGNWQLKGIPVEDERSTSSCKAYAPLHLSLLVRRRLPRCLRLSMASRLVTLCVGLGTPVEERASKTQELLALIGHADREVAHRQLLVEEFLILVRTLQGTELESWLERVKATGARELRQFAHGLERDKAAVVAGLTLPYSTGPVEGHINRLKLLKRQSYGRAGVAHLSRRLLAA
jgi:transposase